MHTKLDLFDHSLTLFDPTFYDSLQENHQPASPPAEKIANISPPEKKFLRSKSVMELQLLAKSLKEDVVQLDQAATNTLIKTDPAHVLDKDGQPLWKKFNYDDRIKHLNDLRKEYRSYDPPPDWYRSGKRVMEKAVNEGLIPQLGKSLRLGIASWATHRATSKIGGEKWIPREIYGPAFPAKTLADVGMRIITEGMYVSADRALEGAIEEVHLQRSPNIRKALQYRAMFMAIKEETAEYEKIIPEETNIPEQLQITDEAINNLIEDYLDYPEDNFNSSAVYSLLERREFLLSSFIPDTERFSDEEKDRLREKLYAYADEHFDPLSAGDFKNAFDKIVDGTPRPNIGNEGAGGTFKTFTPQQLSKFLDCPILDRYTFDALGADNFFGEQTPKLLDLRDSHENLAGQFAMDVIKNRSRSGIKLIINVDDMQDISSRLIDGTKVENFKKVMNPLLHEINSLAFGGIRINIKDILFYTSTNYPVLDAATRSRLGLITPTVSDNKKREKMEKVVEDGLKELSKQNERLGASSGNHPIEKIRGTMTGLYDYIFGCDKKLNPGERNIGEVTLTIFNLIKRGDHKYISEFDIKDAIVRRFHQLLGDKPTLQQAQEISNLYDELDKKYGAPLSSATTEQPVNI